MPGKWEEEKRRSQGTQWRFLLILDTLSVGWASVCVVVFERVKGAADTPPAPLPHGRLVGWNEQQRQYDP